MGTHTEALTGLVSGSWAVGETAVRGTRRPLPGARLAGPPLGTEPPTPGDAVCLLPVLWLVFVGRRLGWQDFRTAPRRL